MTSCPEAMGWKFVDFEKDVSWISTVLDCGPVELVVSWGPVQLVAEWGPVELVVDLGHVDGQQKLSSENGVEKFGFRPLRHTVKFFGSRPAKMKGDLKLHEMCRALMFC